MNKKNYVAPCAELLMLVPAEEITTNSAWTWEWQWGKSHLFENASVVGTNPIWIDALSSSEESADPY